MRFSDVNLLIYDCDGVLTDNRVLVSETGSEYAIFHRGDGYGVQMLSKLGIGQVIISTEKNPIVEYRARKLQIEVLYSVEDKRATVLNYCERNGFDPKNAMFIGNDLNDLGAMLTVGMRGCPHDAEPEIQEICHWISAKDGGYGVIRELYRRISEDRKGQ